MKQLLTDYYKLNFLIAILVINTNLFSYVFFIIKYYYSLNIELMDLLSLAINIIKYFKINLSSKHFYLNNMWKGYL